VAEAWAAVRVAEQVDGEMLREGSNSLAPAQVQPLRKLEHAAPHVSPGLPTSVIAAHTPADWQIAPAQPRAQEPQFCEVRRLTHAPAQAASGLTPEPHVSSTESFCEV
jgi:hypothetical protein